MHRHPQPDIQNNTRRKQQIATQSHYKRKNQTDPAGIKKRNGQPRITGSNTPSTTYVRIEGTHEIAAVSPPNILTPEDDHIGRNM
jgi:hypothetical protein